MTASLVRSSTTAQSDLFNEIQTQVRRYAMSEISLTAFNEWYAPIAWSIETFGDSKAEELMDDITLRLSEYDQEQWSEEQLKELLLDLVNQSRIVSLIVYTSTESIGSTWSQDGPKTYGWTGVNQPDSATEAAHRLR